MQYVLTSEQMKACDRATIQKIGVASLVLMERAALACVQELKQSFDLTDTAVLCGAGNNGGDGLAIARILAEQGRRVTVLLVGEKERMTEDANVQLQIADAYQVPIVSGDAAIDNLLRSEYTTIVDALSGIGLHGALRAPYDAYVRLLNQQHARVLAVDIPSGVNSTTGKVEGEAVRADMTVTFGFYKRGQLLYPGKQYCGICKVADIGITGRSLPVAPECVCFDQGDLGRLPKRSQDSNKGTYGKLFLIAGSKNMCGAACFSAESAYRVGTGLVRIGSDEENRCILQQRIPEAILTTWYEEANEVEEGVLWSTAVGIGPGLSCLEQARTLVRRALLCTRVPVVADADALNLLASDLDILRRCEAPVIVTPHMGEMQRLTGKSIAHLKDDPIAAAQQFAAEYGCICVLKDAATVAADPSGSCYINTSGNNGMSTAGSGDVLTGIIGGLLSQGMDVFEAAKLGVYLHGLAGDRAASVRGVRGMMARDIIDGVAACTCDFDGKGKRNDE